MSDPNDGLRHRDPARQTGPRRKADGKASPDAPITSEASDPADIPIDVSPARPRALSIPYATLPPSKMPSKAPPKGSGAAPADFSDESGISTPSQYSASAIPPAGALPRGVSRTPSAPSRSYLSRSVCRDHGLALSNEGTCLRCVQERAAQRSHTLTRVLITLMVLAVMAGGAIAVTLPH